jgi:membrane protein DedA with SNARE-associated domain
MFQIQIFRNRRASTQLSSKEFIIFAVIVFIGFLVGQWIGAALKIGDDPIGALLKFVIPVLIVYYVWKKWGMKAAQS